MKQWQKYAAEILGTFVLVFVGSLSILNPGGLPAFGFGLGLLAALYAFGEISGGHFNPAVSIAMFLDRRLTALEMFSYWIAQFVGAILASAVILVTYASASTVGKTATVPTGSSARAFVLEIVATAIFIAVILQVTKSGKFASSALIAIPLTLMVIHFALTGISGSSVNPARSFAPVLLSGDHWSNIWIYIIAPPIGAVIGFIAHIVTVKGDTNIKDDLERAMSDVKDVELKDIKAEIPGQGGDAPATGTTA